MMSEGGGGGGAEVLTRARVSAEQLDMLLSFMEEHTEFAAGGQTTYSRFSTSKLWRLLAERLNAAAPDTGGARKSPDKWCRYWADLKYKARKKSAAGGALGELTNAEERLKNIVSGRGGGGGGRARSPSSERKAGAGAGVGAGDDELGSEGSLDARLGSDELLAEAAMRAALAAEKQAEAVAQGVELLRELVCVVRERLPPPPPPAALAPAPAPHPPAALHHDHVLQHHHHRL